MMGEINKSPELNGNDEVKALTSSPDAEQTLVDPGYRLSKSQGQEEKTIPDPGYAQSRAGSDDEKTQVDPGCAKSIAGAPVGGDDKTEIDPGFRKQNEQAGGAAQQAVAEKPESGNETRKTKSQSEGAWAGSSLALPRGHKLYEYRIDNVLGQGGFGITYLATDVHLNAKVAVKEYLPEYFACRSSDKTVSPRRKEDREAYQQGLESFLVEARTLATFRHPNIVRVARFFESNETAYMVLEYERGQSLKAWWKEHLDLPEPDLLSLLNPLLEGLMVVHSTGFLHRDIKPDNIYVRNEDGSLVLLDFGAARQTSSGDLCEDCVVTPGYAPYEQYGGGAQGPWTDIYALGATLYWMVTGTKPPPAPDRIDCEDPMIPAEEAGEGRYSPEFLRAIDWSLRPLAKDRPQNINEFRKALFAAHASSLGLQEALQKGTVDEGEEGFLASLKNPGSIKGVLTRFVRSLVRPGSWPIALKMTLAMVLTALLPMIITAYYNLNGSVKSVSAGELRNLELIAQSTAGRIAQLLHDSKNLAKYIATDEDFQQFLVKPGDEGKIGLQKKLDGLIKSNPDALLMFVMDTKGTALAATDPRIVGKNYQFREYFREAVKGQPFMTGIMVGKTTGLAGIYYANPVFDARNKVIGVVVMRIKADSFGAILDEVRMGSRRTPFLVDGDGVVIHHPDQALLYHSLDRLPKPLMDKILANETYGRDKVPSLDMPDLASIVVGAKKPSHAVYYSTVSKTSEIIGYAPVRGHNWVVCVSETSDSFAEPLNRMFYNVLYSVVLVGLFFLLIALLFARTIVQPINALTRAAHALKSGDYDKAHIAVTSNDEVGQLARTFNVMIDVLRQRERERQRQANNTVQAASKINRG